MIRPGAPETDISSILAPSKPSASVNSHVQVPSNRLSFLCHVFTVILRHFYQVESSSSGNPTEKKLVKLRKKLQQIHALKERFAGGEQLESTQVGSQKYPAD